MLPKTTSPRKLAAARANGALSRGPVTPEGKARSAQNALKHGLTARAIVLATEDAAEYDHLRASYFAQFQPRTHYECDLVDTLVGALWRSRRATCMESAAYDLATEDQREEVDRQYDNCSPDVRAVLAFRADLRGERAIATLGRFALRFEREYRRTLVLLLDLLSRPPVGPNLAEVDAHPECEPQPAPQTEKQNGKNEPNPISGHQLRIVRFTRPPLFLAAGCNEPRASASGTIPRTASTPLMRPIPPRAINRNAMSRDRKGAHHPSGDPQPRPQRNEPRASASGTICGPDEQLVATTPKLLS